MREDRIRQRYFAAQLDKQAARTLYPDLDFVTAGQVPPNGLGERVDGGYRLSGHWTFGSGCTHADVIATGFLVTENGKPVMIGGAPHTRIAFAPASHFEIIDTWHSTGLAGSGSNDYRVKDLFVPDAHTIAQGDPPQRSEPLYCYFGMFLTSWHDIFPPPPMPLRQRPHARVALAKAE